MKPRLWQEGEYFLIAAITTQAAPLIGLKRLCCGPSSRNSFGSVIALKIPRKKILVMSFNSYLQ